MNIGFGFYGIAHGTDKKTGYTRDFRHCWSNIEENLIKPFSNSGHSVYKFVSTYYPWTDNDVEKDFWDMIKPTRVYYSSLEGSDAFTSKSKLHDAFMHEDYLDLIIFTRLDIHFHQPMNFSNIDYNKINILFPEDPQWWESHRFVCDCFYIWNHKFSPQMCSAMRQTYGWPRGKQYPDTHGILNFLVPTVGENNINFLSTECQISNVNTFYTLCRPDVPEHPCKHPDVRAKYG